MGGDSATIPLSSVCSLILSRKVCCLHAVCSALVRLTVGIQRR